MDVVENTVVVEEFEASTEEVVVEEVETTEETHSEEETTVEETSASEDGDEVVVVEEVEVEEVEEVVESENFEIRFELSHDDVRMALYELLSARSENGYYSSWIVSVYDNKFIYEDYEEYKFFRQGYSKDGDTVALDGDPVEVFNEWLSKDEKDALDALKSSYAELKAFKDNYDASMLRADKEDVLNSADYASIADSDEFKALVSEMDNYSIDEIKVKADLLYAAAMKKKFNFAVNEPKETKSVGINFNVEPDEKKQAYAGLFDK